jgi:hypothetical protein
MRRCCDFRISIIVVLDALFKVHACVNWLFTLGACGEFTRPRHHMPLWGMRDLFTQPVRPAILDGGHTHLWA